MNTINKIKNLIKLMLLSLVLTCFLGCSTKEMHKDLHGPQQPQRKRKAQVTVGDIVQVNEVQQGLARTRSKVTKVTAEQVKKAEEFAAAINGINDLNKSKASSKSIEAKPQPMAHMQSSVPLKWTTGTSEALSFGLKDRKVKSPEVKDAKDESKTDKGWRLVE